MKNPLRASQTRTKRERGNVAADADPYVAAAILTDQMELEAIRRGIFRGDAFDEKGRPLYSPVLTDDEEFMRSVYPDWPELPTEKEKK